MARVKQPAKKAGEPKPTPVVAGTLQGVVDGNGRAIAHLVGEGIKGCG